MYFPLIIVSDDYKDTGFVLSRHIGDSTKFYKI